MYDSNYVNADWQTDGVMKITCNSRRIHKKYRVSDTLYDLLMNNYALLQKLQPRAPVIYRDNL